MTTLLLMRLELGDVTNGDGDPLYDEAVIFFAGMHDSPEIRVNAPDALAIADRIVSLWNAADLGSPQGSETP